MSDNITLPREVAKLALDHIEWYIENERGGRFVEATEAAQALRTALAAPQPQPVAWMFVNSEGECEQIEYGIEATDDDSITLLYAAPPDDQIEALRADLAAPSPEPESKTPAWWMDGLTVTLMREGVSKRRAREIAKGYWEAYCQNTGTEDAAIDAAMEDKT